MRKILLLVVAIPCVLFAQTEQDEDIWASFRPLVGGWIGTGVTGSIKSQVEAEYRFLLDGKYLEVRHKAVFPPQEGNPEGEIHEDIGIMSYDRFRGKFVFRQFHVEGFVNQYTLDSLSTDGKIFVFNSEIIENAPPGTRATLELMITGDNELTTKFNVAFPGKEFQCFSKNHLERIE
jgi:hypothetical protein